MPASPRVTRRARGTGRLRRARRVVATLLVASGVACSTQSVMDRIVPRESDAFARAYLDSVRVGSPDAAFTPLSPQLSQQPGVRDSLLGLRAYFAPGVPDSVALVGANVSSQSGVTRAMLTYELHSPGGWTLAQVLVAEEMGVRFIEGVHVQRRSDSLQRLNAFDIRGKSVGHLLFLLMAVAMALFSLWAAVRVALTRPLRRRWLWAFVALFGVTQVGIDWTSGATFTRLLQVELFSAGVMHLGPVAPWIVTFSFPLGAITALRRRRRALAVSARESGSASAGSTAVPSAGGTVHPSSDGSPPVATAE